MDDLAKFTHSIKSDGTEMLVIRTDSEEELMQIRERFFQSIVFYPPSQQPRLVEAPPPPQQQQEQQPPKKPYLSEGDRCHACNGRMVVKTATNRGTGREFPFLGCSNFPNCEFTAYVAKQSRRA